MADLVYKIGADVTDLEKGVAKAESALKDVGGTINKTVTPAINTSNQALQSFDKTIKQTSSELNTIKPAAVNGANALNSIGQVTRDLPFGFIAIQNNLPQVVDSFGALTKQSGGALPALKALGASLAGPAGIAFAFGAVTAGITSLIQKYGSLGNALTVLTAQNKYLVQSTFTYNEETAKAAGNIAVEEAKIATLTKSILSSNTSRDKQIGFYNELKKIAPEVVAGISEENVGTEASNLLLLANTKLRAESVRLKIQEAGITAVATKNAEDLAIATKREADAKIKQAQAEAQYKQYANTPVAAGALSVKTYADAISNAKKEVKDAQLEISLLKSVQSQYLNQLDPITLALANINEQTRLRIEELKKQEKAEKKTADALNRGSKAALNYKYELQSLSEFKLNPEQLDVKNQIERLQELANVVLNVKASEEKRLAALNELKAIEPSYFNGLNLQAQNYNKLKDAIDLTNKDYLTQLTLLERISKVPVKVEVPQKKEKPNLINAPITGIEAPIKLPAAFEEFDKKQKEAADSLTSNWAATYNILNDTFFSPIQDLFSNFLETGKFAIADFGKAILKAINQIVAKIIATGIITLLANLFLPGFGAASGGLGKSLLSGIGSALGFNLGGNVAAPSFAGVGGGTLGMSGQVNVVLRGSDLVGSINRTNATINRVG